MEALGHYRRSPRFPSHDSSLLEREQGDPRRVPGEIVEHKGGDLVAMGGAGQCIGEAGRPAGRGRSRRRSKRNEIWKRRNKNGGGVRRRSLEPWHELRWRRFQLPELSPLAGRPPRRPRRRRGRYGVARDARDRERRGECRLGSHVWARHQTRQAGYLVQEDEVVGCGHRHVEVAALAPERDDEVAPGERRRNECAHVGWGGGELERPRGRAPALARQGLE